MYNTGDQAQQLRSMLGDAPPPAARPSSKTRIITVTSGKGGVGKTNISTNLAILYAQMGKRVVLMDADLGLANVNVVLGMVPKYNLYHVVRKQKSLQDILVQTNYGIRIIAGASGFSKIANMSSEDRKVFIKEMSQISDVDLIIIDTGAGVSASVLSFVAAAHETIIITTTEPTAITDAYGIIKIIATEVPDVKEPPKLLVNRVKSATDANKVSKRIIDISAQFLNTTIEYLGYIYEDDTVHQAVLRQKPFAITNPKSKATTCLHHVVSRLERDGTEKGESNLQGFFSRLFSSSRAMTDD